MSSVIELSGQGLVTFPLYAERTQQTVCFFLCYLAFIKHAGNTVFVG